MKKRKLISSALCLGLLAAHAFAQSARPAAPPAPPVSAVSAAPSKASAASAAAAASLTIGLNPYSWQVVPSMTYPYDSIHQPQPVCRKEGSLFKISVFTSYNNAVRVGEITTPADTFQLLGGAAQTLPGRRDDFAATSVIKTGNDSTVYIFGGANATNELDDVYSYDAAGFSASPVATIPNSAGNTVVGNRSGAVAVPANGMIYLFGGRRGNAVLDQVLEFNPNTNQFTILAAPMPQALYNARGMAKAAAGGPYIYLVGGNTVSGGGMSRGIYRFSVTAKTTQQVMDANNPSQPLLLPPNVGVPTVTWDPSGNVRIIASIAGATVGTWSGMQAWVLNDTYGAANLARATLTPAPFNDPARVRNDAGAVKCGDSTYLIGGTFGHGPTASDRGKLVDKLALPGLKVLKSF